MSAWADELRQAAPDILDVAAHLGLIVSRRRFGPCPACGEGDRHHPPVTPRHNGRGWLCARCKAHGDAIRLTCWVGLGRDRAQSGDEWGTVRARLAAGGWCSADGEAWAWTPPPPRPPPPELPYPDGRELRYLLGACSPVASSLPVARWCQSRGFDPAHVPAAVLPDRYDWPAWWPYGARPWRLVVSMVDARGVVTSMHGRATENTDRGKTRWPLERRAAGLLFADSPGRRLLRGAECPEIQRVLVVEGITDYLAAASRRHPETAVLGACSGGFAALSALPDVWGGVVYVATDSDQAGQRYAAEVERAVGLLVDLRRVVLPSGVDVADYLVDGRPIDSLLGLAGCNGAG